MKNQEICRKLVEREVIYCVSSLVYELSQKMPDETIELWEALDYKEPVIEHIDFNLTVRDCVEWLIETEMSMPYTGNAKKQLKKYLNENDKEETIRFANEHNIEPNYIDIYEHWIVSEWFGRKLEEQGELVVDFMGMTIWGRSTTGQAIYIDGVIKRIASDMEILEGQANEWKTN